MFSLSDFRFPISALRFRNAFFTRWAQPVRAVFRSDSLRSLLHASRFTLDAKKSRETAVRNKQAARLKQVSLVASFSSVTIMLYAKKSRDTAAKKNRAAQLKQVSPVASFSSVTIMLYAIKSGDTAAKKNRAAQLKQVSLVAPRLVTSLFHLQFKILTGT